MFEIVKEYTGKGHFLFNINDKEIYLDLDFRLIQYSNARIIIKCYSNEELLSSQMNLLIEEFDNNSLKTSYIGGTIQNIDGIEGTIEIEEAYVINGNFIPSDNAPIMILRSFEPVNIVFKEVPDEDLMVCGGLTNFIFGSCENINGFSGFKADMDSFGVSFIKCDDYSKKVKSLQKEEETILVTSKACLNVSNRDGSDFNELFTNLTNLLSYAHRTRISCIYEDYIVDGELLKTILRPIITKKFNKENDLIDSDHLGNCNLKDYLEVTYPKYVEFKNQFGLNIVITIYLESFEMLYLDSGFLLGFTALETLLDGYNEIRNEEGTEIRPGIASKNKKEIKKILKRHKIVDYELISKKISKKVSYPHPSVNDKLNELSKDTRFLFEIKKYDNELGNIRNKIVHTGKFPEALDMGGKKRDISLLTEYGRLIYLIDRILLTILGYKGKPFFDEFNRSMTHLK